MQNLHAENSRKAFLKGSRIHAFSVSHSNLRPKSNSRIDLILQSACEAHAILSSLAVSGRLPHGPVATYKLTARRLIEPSHGTRTPRRCSRRHQRRSATDC